MGKNKSHAEPRGSRRKTNKKNSPQRAQRITKVFYIFIFETFVPFVVNLQEQALLNLKVCDLACGSGHFLIAAHRIARRLA